MKTQKNRALVNSRSLRSSQVNALPEQSHCGGQGFKSPRLHQLIRAQRRTHRTAHIATPQILSENLAGVVGFAPIAPEPRSARRDAQRQDLACRSREALSALSKYPECCVVVTAFEPWNVLL
jgi:hypothetical protein